MPAWRIAFAGTPAFAVPALEAVLGSGHELVAVFTQPDRRAGRGRRLTPPPVKATATAAGVSVFQPERLTLADFDTAVGPQGVDLLIVVAFGQVLPGAVLARARRGAINVHASLLPRWRGAAPIARALLAGDDASGVTVMAMVPALDAGPIVLQRVCPVAADETAASLHDRLAALGAQALTRVLEAPRAHLDAARPQPETGVTYAERLTRAEGEIDWHQSAAAIERAVRALQPWPMAWTPLADGPLRIWAARAQSDAAFDEPPGTVIAAGRDGIDVATGAGRLRLERVQPAGRRAMSAADWANARALTGMRLGAA